MASCAQPPSKDGPKQHPDFTKDIADPEVKSIVNEYMELSKRYNIEFTENVTVGFSSINKNHVIGTCTYGKTFREITIDGPYWDQSSGATKVALLYHELTHCYCGRQHDFGDGTPYPEPSFKDAFEEFMSKQPNSPLRPKGYLDDSCPQSVMHPIVLSDECIQKHYDYYVKEMFERCDPY